MLRRYSGFRLIMPCDSRDRTRPRRSCRHGFTLIEILVAMAITLVMMAAVAEIFSSLGRTVNDSRATVEMSGRVRGARNLLQKDLSSTTCPKLPPIRPEAGVGYFEYVEGVRNDDALLDDVDDATGALLTTGTETNIGGPTTIPADQLAPIGTDSLVNRSTLGDHDDILMFTARSRGEPFVGRYGTGTINSQVAEIVWFAVENPLDTTGLNPDGDSPLGEPGLRTIYRRVLLVRPDAPIPPPFDNISMLSPIQQRAALVAFQELYDISARLEGGSIVLNTLADLTKRENRFEHHTLNSNLFPTDVVSGGSTFSSPANVDLVQFDSLGSLSNEPGVAEGRLDGRVVEAYDLVRTISAYSEVLRPYALVTGGSGTATARVILNDYGEVVHITRGLVPLVGSRRGEDVVLTNVLAWDVRAFDSGAPLFADPSTGAVVGPGDSGYAVAGEGFTPVGFGAYADLNYYVPDYTPSPTPPEPTKLFAGYSDPANRPLSSFFLGRWFASPHAEAFLSQLLVPTYDTWSFHYEHDGIDQDDGGGGPVDEGTDGFDNAPGGNGVDDIGERETLPPYPAPLRGIQVTIRVYEPDSRAVREVSVRQHFVPE